MIFNRKKKHLSAPAGRWTEKIAQKTTRYQRKVAERLNRWAAGYSHSRQRTVLILYVMLFGGYCLYVLLGAIL